MGVLRFVWKVVPPWTKWNTALSAGEHVAEMVGLNADDPAAPEPTASITRSTPNDVAISRIRYGVVDAFLAQCKAANVGGDQIWSEVATSANWACDLMRHGATLPYVSTTVYGLREGSPVAVPLTLTRAQYDTIVRESRLSAER